MKKLIAILLLSVSATYARESEPYTVFVHGTRPPDVVDKIVTMAHNFCTVDPGLHKLSDISKKYQLAKALPQMAAVDKKQFPAENIYTFGWCGELSPEARKKSAEELYTVLVALRKRMPKGAKLKLITHSHGGNLALHLAQAEDKYKNKLVIDELILLAVPVQEKTLPFIKHSMFKDIISLYSAGDMVQILDLQGLHADKKKKRSKKNAKKESVKEAQKKKLFSERLFPAQKNLTQVRVRSGKRDILHTEFICAPFLKALPPLLKKIRADYASWRGDDSGHMLDIKRLKGT